MVLCDVRVDRRAFAEEIEIALELIGRQRLFRRAANHSLGLLERDQSIPRQRGDVVLLGEMRREVDRVAVDTRDRSARSKHSACELASVRPGPLVLEWRNRNGTPVDGREEELEPA